MPVGEPEGELAQLGLGLGMLLGVHVQGREEVVRDRGLSGVECIAHVLELGHRQHAVRRSGVAEREDDRAFLEVSVGPGEMEVARVDRDVVLVGTTEGEVERVAGIPEVVGIAPEVARAELRREDDPDVGVDPVDVQVDASAAIERYELQRPTRMVGPRLREDTLAVLRERPLDLLEVTHQVDAREDRAGHVLHVY